jgi:pimeloyl-ACP methyl ester carboxylesterase
MTTYTHQTAPTQFVEANGIRFAYRRFGKATGVPIVFNQHYTGTMDHWDPAVTDGFAREREVIRFRLRAKDRDPEVNEQVAPAQRAAIAKWAAPRERPYDYLKAIQQPTLVVNGSNDVIIYTVNSFILQQNLPNAQSDHLSGLCTRLSSPISRTLCASRFDVPVRGGGSRVLGLRKRPTFRNIGPSGARSCPTSPVKPLS